MAGIFEELKSLREKEDSRKKGVEEQVRGQYSEPKSPLAKQLLDMRVQETHDTRAAQREFAEKAPEELTGPAKEILSNLGKRSKVLETLRSLTPEQREQVLQVAPGVAQQMGDERPGMLGRAAQALGRGISHGVSQPLMELTGLGGTNEEIDLVRQFDAVAAGEFHPYRPGDPWYQKAPLQAVEMVPWMATTVGGAGLGRAAATGAAKGLAGKAAVNFGRGRQAMQWAGRLGELGGTTTAAFPSQYAQEVDSLKAAGVEDGAGLRAAAALTAAVQGVIEGIVPNPFRGKVELTKGATVAARQYLTEALKNAPGELSEEYLQGVASGIDTAIATHLSENAPDQGFDQAFSKGWEQAKEAALPLAFLMGVPAAGGAGVSAYRARRATGVQNAAKDAFEQLKAQSGKQGEQELEAAFENDQASELPVEEEVEDSQPELPPEPETVGGRVARQQERFRGRFQGRAVERKEENLWLDPMPALAFVKDEPGAAADLGQRPTYLPKDFEETVGLTPPSDPDIRRQWKTWINEASQLDEEMVDALQSEPSDQIGPGWSRVPDGVALPDSPQVETAETSFGNLIRLKPRGKQLEPGAPSPTDSVAEEQGPVEESQPEESSRWKEMIARGYKGSKDVPPQSLGEIVNYLNPTDNASQASPGILNAAAALMEAGVEPELVGEAVSRINATGWLNGEMGIKKKPSEVTDEDMQKIRDAVAGRMPEQDKAGEEEKAPERLGPGASAWAVGGSTPTRPATFDSNSKRAKAVGDALGADPADPAGWSGVGDGALIEAYQANGSQPGNSVEDAGDRTYLGFSLATELESRGYVRDKGVWSKPDAEQQEPSEFEAKRDAAIAKARKNWGDDITAREPANAEEQDQLDFLESRGKQASFFDGGAGLRGGLDEQSGFILIAGGRDSSDIWRTIGHELAHETGLDKIIPADSEMLEEGKKKRLARAGDAYRKRMESDPELLEREARADIVGEFLRDKAFRDKLANENPTLWEKLRDAVMKVVGKWSPSSEAEAMVLEELRKQPGKKRLGPQKPKDTDKASKLVKLRDQREAAIDDFFRYADEYDGDDRMELVEEAQDRIMSAEYQIEKLAGGVFDMDRFSKMSDKDIADRLAEFEAEQPAREAEKARKAKEREDREAEAAERSAERKRKKQEAEAALKREDDERQERDKRMLDDLDRAGDPERNPGNWDRDRVEQMRKLRESDPMEFSKHLSKAAERRYVDDNYELTTVDGISGSKFVSVRRKNAEVPDVVETFYSKKEARSTLALRADEAVIASYSSRQLKKRLGPQPKAEEAKEEAPKSPQDASYAELGEAIADRRKRAMPLYAKAETVEEGEKLDQEAGQLADLARERMKAEIEEKFPDIKGVSAGESVLNAIYDDVLSGGDLENLARAEIEDLDAGTAEFLEDREFSSPPQSGEEVEDETENQEEASVPQQPEGGDPTSEAGQAPTSTTDKPSVLEQPPIPEYTRTTPPVGSPQRIEREERIKKNDLTLARLNDRKKALERERDGLRRNATKKRAAVQSQIRSVQDDIQNYENAGRDDNTSQTIEQLEDQLESPRSYDHYLAGMKGLHRALANRADDAWRANRISRDEARRLHMQEERKADQFSMKLQARAKDVAQQQGMNAADADQVAMATDAAFTIFDDRSLEDAVGVQMERTRESRIAKSLGMLEPTSVYGRSPDLTPEQVERFREEYQQIAQDDANWQKRVDELDETVAETRKANRRVEEDKKKEEAEKAAKEKANNERSALKKAREKAREKSFEERIGPAIKKYKLKGRETVYVRKDDDGNILPVKGVRKEGDVKADYYPSVGMTIAPRVDEDGKTSGFLVLSSNIGKRATTANKKGDAIDLVRMMDILGMDMSGFKTEKDAPSEFIARLGKLVRTWEDLPDISAMDEKDQAVFRKLASGKAPVVEADIVLNFDDLNALSPKTFKAPNEAGQLVTKFRKSALELVKELTEVVPEFAYDPVFTFDDGLLVYRDGFRIAFDPTVFHVHPSELKNGQTVGVDIDDLVNAGVKRKTAQEVVAEAMKNDGFANVKKHAKGGVSGSHKGKDVTIGQDDDGNWDATAFGREAQNKADAMLRRIRWSQDTVASPLEEPPAEEQAAVNFSAEGLVASFGLTEEQVVAVEQLADAMGLDKSKIEVSRSATIPKDALKQINEAADKMAEAGKTYSSEEEFFDAWQQTLNTIGKAVKGFTKAGNISQAGVDKAVAEAMADLGPALSENAVSREYYAAEARAEREALAGRYPELAKSDDAWAFYKLISAVSSNSTSLPENVTEQIDAWHDFRDKGFLDVETGRNAGNQRTLKRSAFPLHGGSQAVKAGHFEGLNRMLEEQGSMGAVIKHLMTTIPVKELRQLPFASLARAK